MRFVSLFEGVHDIPVTLHIHNRPAALSGLVQRLAGERFPLGTMAVNLLGCLLFGFVWGYLEGRVGLSPQTRTIVLTGFMGAFTTFSTYAFETVTLVRFPDGTIS